MLNINLPNLIETLQPILNQRHHLERRGTFGDFLKSVLGADTNPPDSAIRAGRNLNYPKSGPYPYNLPYAEDKSSESGKTFYHTTFT